MNDFGNESLAYPKKITYFKGITSDPTKQITNPNSDIAVSKTDHVLRVSFSVKPLSL